MEFTEFAIRIVFIFLPGLVAFTIFEALTVHKRTTVPKIIIGSLLLGFLSYLSFHKLAVSFPCLKLTSSFFGVISNSKTPLNFQEIFWASILAIPIGYITSAADQYKVVHRIAHKFSISRKFGDIDVWSFVMNTNNIGWVTLRDFEQNMMFQGWIEAFSDSSEDSGSIELLLSQVSVFENNTGNPLFSMPALYISRRRDTITMEIH